MTVHVALRIFSPSCKSCNADISAIQVSDLDISR